MALTEGFQGVQSKQLDNEYKVVQTTMYIEFADSIVVLWSD